PKLTFAPRVAIPLLRPFCSLRYLRLDGCSTFHSWLTRFPRRWRRLGRSTAQCRLLILGQDLALIYPHLDADYTIGGLGFCNTILNVGSQRMQRYAALAIPFGTGNLDA